MEEKIPLPKNLSIKFNLDNLGRLCEIPLVLDHVYKINSNRFGLRYLAVVIEYNQKVIKIFSPELKDKTRLLKDKQAEINFNSKDKFYYFPVEVIEILNNGEFIIKMPEAYQQDQRRSHVRAYQSLDVQVTQIDSKPLEGLDGKPLSLISKDLSATGLKLTSAIQNLLVKNLKLGEADPGVPLPRIGLEFTLENTTFTIVGEIVWAHRLGSNYEHGVRFIDAKLAAQDAIMKFVFEQELANRKKSNQ